MNNEQNNFSKKLGESIKYHRKLAHLSQEELANKLGYRNKASIAKIEAGQTRMKASKFIEAAKIFGIEVGEMINEARDYEIKEIPFDYDVELFPINSTPKEIPAPTQNTFRDCVTLLTNLNEEELQKAYKLLSLTFGE